MEMQSVSYVQEVLELRPQGKEFLSTLFSKLPMKALLNNLETQIHVAKGDAVTTSKLWYSRQIWSHYRVGSIDEIQQSVQRSVVTQHSQFLNFDPTVEEHKQVMDIDTFRVLLADLCDYYLPDNVDKDKVEKALSILHKYNDINANSFISFSEFATTIDTLLISLLKD